ncbi:MAG TPA: glycosyltransferase family 1 protein [Albitalea sp.]|uniref:glycosyltransferase family 4 protein n=1 Tax=Piscinibacter sp. TaxID=1903157 RepID=UPI002ED5C4A6
MKILLEMRPALEGGHAGIPQENRLLFRGLCGLDGMSVEGLLQSGGRVLAQGLPGTLNGEERHRLPPDQAVNRMSRVVVSLQQPTRRERLEHWRRTAQSMSSPAWLTMATLLGMRQKLTAFDPEHFRDFVWRSLFAKTLPAEDFDAVTRAPLRVAQEPYGAMHACGLLTRRLGHAMYPTLDTRGIDVMIAQTPYPAVLAKPTRLVVRYMDAIPLLLPHTITRKTFHQASHYQALRRNVKSGAWFACASEATRRDLVSIFPQAEPRAVTIPCMLSHHYFPQVSSPVRVREILDKRANAAVGVRSQAQALPSAPPAYLLMVSTIEPRKNHLTLLGAWEQLKNERHPELKLVVVGSMGWDQDAILARFRPWIERGDLFLLEDVPADELRLLYRHAKATVCPSLAEGFDYSGVEAMRCGGVVAASDIPVHRDVYDDAAEYFSPYSVGEAALAIDRLIDAQHEERRLVLTARGAQVASRYLPERILPQWRDFLGTVMRTPFQTGRT